MANEIIMRTATVESKIEPREVIKSIIIWVFLYSTGPTLHHCMRHRFEPTESRLQCGEVPSLIWLLSLKERDDSY